MHDTDSLTTRVVTDGPTAAPEPQGLSLDLEPGSFIGRYRVVERIGEGGMGIVYCADDPHLDRRVAIKLLRDRSRLADHRARSRLVREAQAMAKLSHENVLPIYDVATEGAHVFLAMELVDGRGLDEWLREEKPEPAALLKVFTAAGRGLAAAHHAGLVHRDFKPSNVLIGRDGRVRVLDFGLARIASSHTGEATGEPSVQEAPTEAEGDDSLTRTGWVMGTPAYMAPEQHRGAVPEPRSDQFSFCVALYQALYGERPFRGKSLRELAAAMAHERLVVPRRPGIPGAVRHALARGLSIEPDDRFGDMDGLLDAISGRRTAARRRTATLGGVAVLALGVTGWQLAAGEDAEPCRGVDARADEVWNETRARELSDAFGATGLAHAGDTWSRTRLLVDDYAGKWRAIKLDACQATRVRHEQSEADMDLRSACLASRLDALEQLLSVLASPDRKTVIGAFEAASNLPSVTVCESAEAILRDSPLPEDAERRERVREIQSRIAYGQFLREATRPLEAQEVAEKALVDAKEVGHVPTQIDALRLVSAVLSDRGKYEDAAGYAEEAVWLAEEARLDRVAATVAIQLIYTFGVELEDPEQAARFAELAKAKVDRVGQGGELEAALEERLGDLDDVRGEYEDAREHYEKALARWSSIAPGSVGHARALAAMGRVHFRREDFPRAREVFARAGDMLADRVGEGHPDVAKMRGNVAVASHSLGDYQRARDEMLGVVASFRGAYGDEHPAVATSLTNLGNAYYRMHEYEDAVATGREAVALKEALYGENSPKVAYSLNNLAMSEMALGRLDEAAASYERAIELRTISFPADHPALAVPLEGLGELRYKQGRAAEAVELLERALKIEAGAGRPDWSLAIPKFLLGRALMDAELEQDRALALVREAVEVAAAHRDKDRQLSKVVTDGQLWLEKHG